MKNTYRHNFTPTYRHTDTQADRLTDIQKHRHTNMQTPLPSTKLSVSLAVISSTLTADIVAFSAECSKVKDEFVVGETGSGGY